LKHFRANHLGFLLILNPLLALIAEIRVYLAGQRPNILNYARHLNTLLLDALSSHLIYRDILSFIRPALLILMGRLEQCASGCVLTMLLLTFQLFCKEREKALNLVAHLAKVLKVDLLMLAHFRASLLYRGKLVSLIQQVTFLGPQLSFKSLGLLFNK